jgi:putative membrane protein
MNEIIRDQQLISEHLANERTFLAWIRTGIGIMAFGFVVVKFSVFLVQVGNLSEKVMAGNILWSQIIGISLVVAG